MLPTWVVWFPVLAGVTSAVLAASAASLLAAWAGRPLRALPPDAHWSERARLAWPVRRIGYALWVPATVIPAVLFDGGPLSLPPSGLRWVALVCLPLAALAAVALRTESRLVPGFSIRARLRSTATYVLLLWSPLLAAILLSLAGVPESEAGLAAALAIVVALATGGGLHLARAAGLVRPPPDRARAALARALGDEELAAVMAHELGHLAEPRRIALLRTATAAVLPAAVVAAPALWSRGGPVAAAGAVAAALAWLALFRALSRRMEQRADGAAHAHGPIYARALEELHRVNLLPAVLGRRSSHPDLYDRLVQAGAAPSWPRPEPPPRARRASRMLGLAVLLASVFAGTFAFAWASRGSPRGRIGVLLALAVRHDAADLAEAGAWHAARGEIEAAVALCGAAEAIEPWNAGHPATLALLLARAGRCPEAVAAHLRAASLDPDAGWVEPEVLSAACAPR